MKSNGSRALPIELDSWGPSETRNYNNIEEAIIDAVRQLNSSDYNLRGLEKRITKINPGAQFIFPREYLFIDYETADPKTRDTIGKLIIIHAFYLFRKYSSRILKVKEYPRIFDPEDVFSYIYKSCFESYKKYNPSMKVPYEIFVETRIQEVITHMINQGANEIERYVIIDNYEITLTDREYYRLKRQGLKLNNVKSRRLTQSIEDLIQDRHNGKRNDKI